MSGKKYDEKSDVYSFGIVFYEIVSRNLPFTEFQQYIQIINEWTEFQCQVCPKGSCSNLPTCKFVPVQVTGRREEFKKQLIITAITENNLRPTVPKSCPASWRNLIEQLWHPNPKQRPSFKSAVAYLKNMPLTAETDPSSSPWNFCFKSNVFVVDHKEFLSISSLQREKKSFRAFRKFSGVTNGAVDVVSKDYPSEIVENNTEKENSEIIVNKVEETK